MDRQEQVWKHRFVVAFVTLLKNGGYDASDDDALDLAYESANASWPERDDDDTPEDSALGEYYSIAESV